jgi:hypothetical protein
VVVLRPKRLKIWPVDPANVQFASVTPPGVRGVPTSYVRVQYEGDSAPRYVPLGTFIGQTKAKLEIGHLLGIEQLSVSPKCYGRYRDFFDRLSDWSHARQRVLDDAKAARIRFKQRTPDEKSSTEIP